MWPFKKKQQGYRRSPIVYGPYPDYCAHSGLPGHIITKRKIEKCSTPGEWYENMVGQIIRVHFFSTFGAWTTDGKWLHYYDLGPEIK